MKRREFQLATILTLLVLSAGALAQQATSPQPAPKKSLAQRIASLRLGWGKSNENAAQEPQRLAQQSPSSSPTTSSPTTDAGQPKFLGPVRVQPAQPAPLKVAMAPSTTQRAGSTPRLSAPAKTNSGLPRVNPYNLMPPDLGLTAPVATNSVPNRASAPETPSFSAPGSTASGPGIAAGSSGSARDRMLRDLQQVAQPSVNAGGMPSLAPSVSTKPPANSQVAKSIASEVASEMKKSAPADNRYTAPPLISPVQIAPTPSNSPRVVLDAGGQKPQPQLTRIATPLPAPAIDAEDFRPAIGAAAKAASANTTNADDDLLLTQQAPLLVSRVSGPAQIIIGREAAYRVTIANRGDAPATQLLARIIAPQGAELVNASASVGAIRRPNSGSEPGAVEWRLDKLATGKIETLDLVLVATSGKPVELAVSFEQAPLDSRTLVEVQEPKLEMTLNGPEEVQYAKPQMYRLTVSNPGTGVTEDIQIELTPPGAEPTAAITHKLGDLAPGATQSVEIELTARDAGQLALHASASAMGGIKTAAEKAIFCRKAELAVDCRGPQQKYTGATASYFFRVRNPGTAVAEHVQFQVELPVGFEVTSTSEGQVFDAASNTVTWRVGSLRPGDDHYLELQGVMRNAGACQLQVIAATADGITTAAAAANTDVIAVADLKLDVHDPKGPLAVGEEAVYEIRVRNRGAIGAENVRVVALFSEGIEPQRVEGSQVEIADGRVAFSPIQSLGAGRETVYRIYAKAHTAGTHVFRAEVLCKELDIKLAAEETTRFFQDDVRPSDIPHAAADQFNAPR